MLRKLTSLYRAGPIGFSPVVRKSFSKKLYSNPTVSGFKKAFRYETYLPNMNLASLEKLTGEKPDHLVKCASIIGIPLEKSSIVSFEDATALTLDYGVRLFPKDQIFENKRRNPVITIMGHVDHGKTTLLDSIRNSRIAHGEYGGITQKIGAFQVKFEDKKISFIDTPGHEIFTKMRSRGASCTDLIVLVVAANDGMQPQVLLLIQTYEVINLAQAYEVPMIIAINKIDMKAADPERVENQLTELGLDLETKGGNIPVIHISALKKINVDLLVELIAFETDILELKADTLIPGEGMVLEARKSAENDIKNATVVVQNGIVKTNDLVLFNNGYSRIKEMADDRNTVFSKIFPGEAGEIVNIHNLARFKGITRLWFTICSSFKRRNCKKNHENQKV